MAELKPVTPMDKKMAKRHHKDSVRYNKAHAKDHLKAAAQHMKALGMPCRNMGSMASSLMKGKA